MHQITVENYRCFYHKQTARMAPLTLLVGENSTGKTSLMAMIRILEDLAFGNEPLDFKKEPYDLGSFDDIAHFRGTNIRQSETFKAGFCATNERNRRRASENRDYQFDARFGEKDTSPIATQIHLDLRNCWIKWHSAQIEVGTAKGSWITQYNTSKIFSDIEAPQSLPRLASLVPLLLRRTEQDSDQGFNPISGSPELSQEDMDLIHRELLRFPNALRRPVFSKKPYIFANAPVRSKPYRTYDPDRHIRDPEGDYVPMYLFNTYSQDKDKWDHLKNSLQKFGRSAGLFDEISIQSYGKRHSGPFHIQIKKSGRQRKGHFRNLIDVGYGVSQVLPVITELLREEAPTLLLLQQPEVHLHPSAQAALGSLFCQIARPNQQLVVETHSDYLLDRVRLDVRDEKTHLRPDDVSILFFERNDLDVTIHSLRIDEEGNVLDVPPAYRDFFMQETANLLRL